MHYKSTLVWTISIKQLELSKHSRCKTSTKPQTATTDTYLKCWSSTLKFLRCCLTVGSLNADKASRKKIATEISPKKDDNKKKLSPLNRHPAALSAKWILHLLSFWSFVYSLRWNNSSKNSHWRAEYASSINTVITLFLYRKLVPNWQQKQGSSLTRIRKSLLLSRLLSWPRPCSTVCLRESGKSRFWLSGAPLWPGKKTRSAYVR